MNEKEKDLLNIFDDYKAESFVPMHMPGHKQNPALSNGLPFEFDVTEVYDFDDLHEPMSVLKSLNEEIAQLFGSRESFLLVNGSTCGILAAIRTLTKRKDMVLVARNCHKSVMHAIEICGLLPIFITPEYINEPGFFGSINPKKIEKVLDEYKGIKLVIITSPTYEGVISDIKGISDICHNRGIPLLTDEAHGAHLGFKGFPESSIKLGSDVSVQSLHKTLSGLTQTALLHVNSDFVDMKKLRHNLSVFQTSSPSYVFMVSAYNCVKLLKQDEHIFQWSTNLYKLQEKLAKLKNVKTFNEKSMSLYGFDPSKLVFYGSFSGLALEKYLMENKILAEMYNERYVLAMTGIGDTENSFDKLARSLKKFDEMAESIDVRSVVPAVVLPELEATKIPIADAVEMQSELISIDDISGKVIKGKADVISAEYVSVYPPGIPILVPGMPVSIEIADYISRLEKSGENVQKNLSEKGFLSILIDSKK